MAKKTIREVQIRYGLETGHQTVRAKPFIKWAGGKWMLIPSFAPYFPNLSSVNSYFEPFLGGGAVFFHLQHPKSYLSDSNEELVELYQIVRDQVDELVAALAKHRNESDHYYKVRDQDPALLSPVARAARFIFLNKTCYNGLYRVNGSGQFNVPFGRYEKPKICDARGLRASSMALQKAELRAIDFEEALAKAGAGDFVYLDPPYHPVSKTASFTAYTSSKFDEGAQLRLSQVYTHLSQRSCFVMLSNSDTPAVRRLYKGFRIIELQANRAINCKAGGRGKVTELLILNY